MNYYLGVQHRRLHPVCIGQESGGEYLQSFVSEWQHVWGQGAETETRILPLCCYSSWCGQVSDYLLISYQWLYIVELRVPSRPKNLASRPVQKTWKPKNPKPENQNQRNLKPDVKDADRHYNHFVDHPPTTTGKLFNLCKLTQRNQRNRKPDVKDADRHYNHFVDHPPPTHPPENFF